MPRAVILLGLTLVLAGCAAPSAEHGGAHGAAGLDTGDLAPGASRTLTYEEAGVVAMHCHPHPFMRHEVTVTDAAPGPAHVHVLDGESAEDFRFEPANLTVGKGSEVTYHNHGRLTHTATERGAA